MPIAHEFAYVKPQTLAETVALLAQHGATARVLSGGTDLVGWLRDELVQPEVLVDIKGIAELRQLEFAADTLQVGALTTFSDLLASQIVRQKFPLLCEMARTVGSRGIRNRATLVGNICSAVPCCDGGPALLVYEADVWVAGQAGKRKIPVTQWFTGPRQTALAPGEMVTRLEISCPGRSHGGAYVKLGRYQGEDLAQASVAVLALPSNDYRIAFGAVAPTPVRAGKIEALLSGKPIDPTLLAGAQNLIPQETAPISDIRASKEYRALMLPVMLARSLEAAVARRDGTGPPYGTEFM